MSMQITHLESSRSPEESPKSELLLFSVECKLLGEETFYALFTDDSLIPLTVPWT